jgi:hypothetical protein
MLRNVKLLFWLNDYMTFDMFCVLQCSWMNMSDRVNATVVGHSYVARLHQGFEEGRFVPRGPRGLRYNFVGIGGARVYPPEGIKVSLGT